MTDKQIAPQQDADFVEEEERDLQSGCLPPAIEPTLPDAWTKLAEAKSQLVIGVPFLGIMTMTCHYRFTDVLPTAAAHSIRTNIVFWNEHFLVNVLTEEQRVFVLAHEILHIFLEHIGRQIDHSYNPKLWNVSTDYAINGFLQEMIDADGKVRAYMKRPEFGLYDQRFLGMSADEIYHKLLDENPDKSPDEIAKEHGGFGDDVGDCEAAGKEGRQVVMDEVPQDQQTEHAKNQNKQAAAASLASCPPDMMSKNRGNAPFSLIRAIQDLIAPKIPWYELLADFVVETTRQNYTYNRLSRRTSGSIVFPSMDGERIDVCFGVDTSGSMSPTELTEALSELGGIITQFETWRLSLISCDTNAHHIGDYESEEGDDITTIDKGLIGGGGTELSPMVEYANDMEDEVNVCVIVTDGYIDVDRLDEEVNSGDVPVIVLITSDGADIEMQHATVIKMDAPEKTHRRR